MNKYGEETIKTNNIKKLRDEDPIFEQVFQLIKNRFPFLINESIISVMKSG